jgi:undecaprenyl-diphosphatase
MQPDQQTYRTPAMHWRMTPVHAYTITALCWIPFLAIVWLMTSGHTAVIDAAGLRYWRLQANLASIGPPWLTQMAGWITALGGVPILGATTLISAGALCRLGYRRDAALLCLTVLTGWIASTAMKAFFQKARPDIVPHLVEASGYSFPSGHSLNSAVVYISIALTFSAINEKLAPRIVLLTAAIVISLIIAWSRLWLGVHFPSDIAGGWLAGTGWAFLANTLLSRTTEERPRDHST